jgi:nicotinamidase-related amidase
MYCYLADGRKKVLPSTPAFEEWFDPDHTAVACIDMHRGHIGPEDAVTCPAPRARDRIPAHNMFHDLCRRIDMPIIHVQHWQRYGGIDGAHPRKTRNAGENWRHLYELYLPANPIIEQHSWEGTKWLDILVEEDKDKDYYVRTKKRMSSFYPTDFEFLINQLGIDNVVLTGTYTEACVLSTAFDAANRDFRVIVPRDIVAGESEEMENGALRIIASHLGLVVDAPAALREWYARKGEELPPILDGVSDIGTVAGPIPVGV